MFSHASTSAVDAGWDERGRVELVDHDRAGEADAGGQVVAPVDRRRDGDAVELHVAQRVRRGQLGRHQLVLGEPGLRRHADRLQLELVDLDRGAVAAVGEGASCSSWNRATASVTASVPTPVGTDSERHWPR